MERRALLCTDPLSEQSHGWVTIPSCLLVARPLAQLTTGQGGLSPLLSSQGPDSWLFQEMALTSHSGALRSRSKWKQLAPILRPCHLSPKEWLGQSQGHTPHPRWPGGTRCLLTPAWSGATVALTLQPWLPRWRLATTTIPDRSALQMQHGNCLYLGSGPRDNVVIRTAYHLEPLPLIL